MELLKISQWEQFKWKTFCLHLTDLICISYIKETCHCTFKILLKLKHLHINWMQINCVWVMITGKDSLIQHVSYWIFTMLGTVLAVEGRMVRRNSFLLSGSLKSNGRESLSKKLFDWNVKLQFSYVIRLKDRSAMRTYSRRFWVGKENLKAE